MKIGVSFKPLEYNHHLQSQIYGFANLCFKNATSSLCLLVCFIEFLSCAFVSCIYSIHSTPRLAIIQRRSCELLALPFQLCNINSCVEWNCAQMEQIGFDEMREWDLPLRNKIRLQNNFYINTSGAGRTIWSEIDERWLNFRSLITFYWNFPVLIFCFSHLEKYSPH